MIKKILLAYKFVSQQLLECVKNGEVGEVFIDEREKLLKQLKTIKTDPNEIKKIIDEIKILEIDNEIKLAYEENKSQIKFEINKINMHKEGNKIYSALNYGTLFNGEA